MERGGVCDVYNRNDVRGGGGAYQTKCKSQSFHWMRLQLVLAANRAEKHHPSALCCW